MTSLASKLILAKRRSKDQEPPSLNDNHIYIYEKTNKTKEEREGILRTNIRLAKPLEMRTNFISRPLSCLVHPN